AIRIRRWLSGRPIRSIIPSASDVSTASASWYRATCREEEPLGMHKSWTDRRPGPSRGGRLRHRAGLHLPDGRIVRGHRAVTGDRAGRTDVADRLARPGRRGLYRARTWAGVWT